ncbi:MAG TPA: hypothetical protein VHJ20_23110 [Polyangia bacterium]|nr:hypothetical protein [Polyangia bacterium]
MKPGEAPKGEPLRAALRDALAGRPAALDDLFMRHGGGPDPRPNLKLAAAFGDEVAALDDDGRAPARVLARLAAEDAAPDTAQVFAPMAAAFGWLARARAGHDVELAWDALRELAGDERAPVREATRTALQAFALTRARASELLAHATEWLEAENREVRYEAAGVVVETFGDRQVLAAARLTDVQSYLSRAIAEAADAPRSAERSDGRRRLLVALPRTLAGVVAGGAESDVAWLEAECIAAKQPDVRAALSTCVQRVQAASPVDGRRVRAALEGSAKPPRDPTRIRPGAGRGKASRHTK